MKRFTLRMAAIAAAIIVALTGVSLALARNTGVLDFLFADQPIPTSLPIQTALPQTGGDTMERLHVEVRDAVSDGISIHMSVAFSVRDAENEAVLVDYDVIYYSAETGIEPPYIDEAEEGKGFRKPFVSQLKDKETVYIVGCTQAWYGEVDLVSGINWLYESPGVVVIDYVLDLRDTYFDGWGNPPQLPLPDPLTVRLTPVVWIANDGGMWREVEKGEIDVTLARSTFEARTYAAVNLPVQGEGFTLTAARFTVTPIATYATYEYFDSTDNPGMESDSPVQRSFWIRFLDTEGNEVSVQNGGYKKEIDDYELAHRMEVFHPAMDMPETVMIRPFTWEDAEPFAPITLHLEPVL